MMKKNETFLDMILTGRAKPSDIHDFVGAWHRGGKGTEGQLHEFLGFTREQYLDWVNDHHLLADIVSDAFMAKLKGCEEDLGMMMVANERDAYFER